MVWSPSDWTQSVFSKDINNKNTEKKKKTLKNLLQKHENMKNPTILRCIMICSGCRLSGYHLRFFSSAFYPNSAYQSQFYVVPDCKLVKEMCASGRWGSTGLVSQIISGGRVYKGLGNLLCQFDHSKCG